MRHIKPFLIIVLLTVLATLTACSSLSGENSIFRRPDNRYLHQDQRVNPLHMPHGAYRHGENYPIPNVSGRDHGNPSLTPPDVGGARYQRYKDESYAHKKRAMQLASLGVVTVKEPPKVVWGELGSALKKAGYRVVEKDSSVGSYFVLDVASTAGTVRRNTPVYQLRVNDDQGKTQLALLDAKGHLAKGNVSQRILGDVATQLKV